MSVKAQTNRVLLALPFAALAALWGLDFVSVQPNRIMPGTGQSLVAALGWPGALLLSGGVLAILLNAWRITSPRFWLTLALATLLLALLPLALHWAAQRHVPADQPIARIGLGAGFWALVFLLCLMIIEVLQRLRAGTHWRLLVMAVVLGSLFWFISTGRLDELALLREYQSRSRQFGTALRGHLMLVGGAVGVSLVMGFGLAVQILRRPSWQKPVLGVLSFFQTIPSLALFGLLIAPLSALSAQFPWLQQFGIRGIGWAPAVLALIGYSLLPMVRNTWVALDGVPAGVMEAARGMGMSPLQAFVRVRLPLAVPVVLEGVRITTIQAIGLTAVAALIGAGGFGTFIFQGLGQAANELILLGAIPTILLALLADMIFTALAALTAGYRKEVATS
ncbi:MAG: ABC transporter permease [Natronospirillum sp.]|uniref:ABC transporter permease n=1 Tax=Natronospirillum sp. TaxID=2812955 RepID=UPI0025CC4CB9|nr:ABC transporter permease [Natronospirillum sp.]MCH8551546.1 ABC transporter permease [Natronospirillum sp.]